MVTNSSVVAGFLCLELYKTVLVDRVSNKRRKKKIRQCVSVNSLKNANINLAIPRFVFYTPGVAQKEKASLYRRFIRLIYVFSNLNEFTQFGDKFFTVWDFVEINGPIRLNSLLERIQSQMHVKILAVRFFRCWFLIF